MPRTAAPLLAAAALTLVLSGCTGEPEHTPETAAAIEAWSQELQASLSEGRARSPARPRTTNRRATECG
ncbi:hypothetical protein [Arenivirga flava]|nr:hypothetical protein [Arenivirga flava]